MARKRKKRLPASASVVIGATALRAAKAPVARGSVARAKATASVGVDAAVADAAMVRSAVRKTVRPAATIRQRAAPRANLLATMPRSWWRTPTPPSATMREALRTARPAVAAVAVVAVDATVAPAPKAAMPRRRVARMAKRLLLTA